MKKILILYAAYGGGHLSAAKSIKEYIDNTKDTAVNILSNLIFNSLFKETSINKYLSDCLMSNLSNIKFSEKIHFYDEIYLLTLDQMNECYKLAKEILKMIPLEGKDQYEQTYLVYRYIISHVSYDHDSLKFRDLNYEKVLKESSPKKEYILNAYEYAKMHDFRFFSFGDAMFIKKF